MDISASQESLPANENKQIPKVHDEGYITKPSNTMMYYKIIHWTQILILFGSAVLIFLSYKNGEDYFLTAMSCFFLAVPALIAFSIILHVIQGASSLAKKK